MNIEFVPVQEKIAALAIRFIALVLIPLFALAAYWSARLARADSEFRADTLASLAQAVALDPANARYEAWRAELLEHEARDPGEALDRASALNPRDSALLIRRGLRAEQHRDFVQAARLLEQAAQVDRQFDPRATLAHYYFRRGDAPNFWRAIREALAIGYGDLTPLFRLSWRMSADPEIIRAALPPDPAVAASYLAFLLADHPDAAAAAAPAVAAQAAPRDLPLLLSACDRFLDAARTSTALATWNAFCRLVPYPPLHPEKSASLTNGDFLHPPLNHAFDWRVADHPEITVTRAEPPALQFEFSGRQPESLDLLRQILPLQPRRKYALVFHYRAPGPGLSWQLDSQSTRLSPASDWTAGVFAFTSGDAAQAALVLEYQRPPGSPRLAGTLALRALALRFAE